ncbi:hypothetical protein BC777_0941 [Yoonia maricola]|uniref:Uncharacterized protein n=1 Tax=Yoonia maricola TaxID=420999 RepID=A0A2M8WMD5_9RHOB|nr:hypothetical protein [Yoonia maricola]PJI92097.1 hypothetical protein BC777_0941 [Yoonia maricola]
MIPLSGILIGAIFGALRAKARGGKGKDMLQWGAVFAIIFGVIGMFVLIFLQRSLT